MQGLGKIGFKSYLDVHEYIQVLLALVKFYSHHLSIHSETAAAKYTFRQPTTARQQ